MNPASLKNLKPPFKKGEVHNPLGYHARDEKMKEIVKEKRLLFKELVDIALTGSLADLTAIAKDPTSSAIKVGVATSLADAIKKGNWDKLQSIVRELIGKEVEKVDITTNGKDIKGNTVTKVFLKLPPNGRTKEENEK